MSDRKRVNLALQGGGAHGAYTWGVLDRLLEEPRLEIAALSGASAGALNGAAFKAGMVAGGADGAKAALRAVWTQVQAGNGPLASALTDWFRPFLPDAGTVSSLIEASPAWQAMDISSRLVSPYASGPFYAHPLQTVVDRLDFSCICCDEGPGLFISATNVRSGKVRVFGAHEVTSDVILASACLPTLFRAVEFRDPATGTMEAFWDGGYTGNPALFPLFDPALPDDVIIVNINPLYRDSVPHTPTEIQNRINEISFNASLLRELRAVSFVKKLIANGKVEAGAMKDVLVHMISDDALMTELSVATKTLAIPAVIDRLFDAGRQAADRFLQLHIDDLNQRGTVDLQETFN